MPLDDGWEDALARILNAQTGDLSMLVALAGGDPRYFYLGTDLSGVDVRGQDLRHLNLPHLDRRRIRSDAETQFGPSIVTPVGSRKRRSAHKGPRPFICVGLGVHTGVRVRVAVRPAPVGMGITFIRTDVLDRDNRIPVSSEAVVDARLNTMIENAAGVRISTIEHIMAALAGLGISDVLVEVDGPEMPILDGSALPFVQLLDDSGFRRGEAPVRHIEILEPVRVQEGDKSAALLPCDRFEMRFEIDFDSQAIGNQVIDFVVDERTFRSEIMAARAFGFAHEIEALRNAGLARGGSMENAVLIDGNEILNPGGLRMEREFVRHKALNAIGDLYVLGAPLLGRYEGYKAGHSMNIQLVRELLANPSAWRWSDAHGARAMTA